MAASWDNGTRSGRSSRCAVPEGDPPYLVRYPDGHETLMYPGPDAVVEHAPRS